MRLLYPGHPIDKRGNKSLVTRFFMEMVTSHSPKLSISQITKTSCPKLTRNLNLNYRIPLKIYHQNIRGLRCKTNELMGHLHPILPEILCFTEHHAHWEELQQIFVNDYKLATYFCRTSYAKGGACMYVHKSIKNESVDIENYCKEKHLEACATKLTPNFTHICIITIYRALSGNFIFFYK